MREKSKAQQESRAQHVDRELQPLIRQAVARLGETAAKCLCCATTKVTTITKSRSCLGLRIWWLALFCTALARSYEKKLGTIWRNIMNKNTESILDKVTAEIRSEQIDPRQSMKRQSVFGRGSPQKIQDEGHHDNMSAESIENCADFQSLIPAYLNGDLSEARSLLFVDHTHECIPCRKAMKEARSRSAAPKKTAPPRAATVCSPSSCVGVSRRHWSSVLVCWRFLSFSAMRRSVVRWKQPCKLPKVRFIKLPTLPARR